MMRLSCRLADSPLRVTWKRAPQSVPNLAPSTNVSITAIWLMSFTMLLMSLAMLPLPTGPISRAFAETASSAGLARSQASASPPSITVSLPSHATWPVPETGASR